MKLEMVYDFIQGYELVKNLITMKGGSDNIIWMADLLEFYDIQYPPRFIYLVYLYFRFRVLFEIVVLLSLIKLFKYSQNYYNYLFQFS